MAKKKQDTLDARDLAAMYGWAMAVLRSDKSLYSVFKKAVAQTWTPERFTAEVRNTRWFKTHSDAARAYAILAKSDPATMKARRNSTNAAIRDMAEQMGAQLPNSVLSRITTNVLQFGWNDAQIQNTLANAVKPNSKGVYAGQAALNIDHVRETAANHGITLGDDGLRTWAARMAAGEPVADFDAFIKGRAADAFPGWADQIKAGRTVRELADPYINTMAQTLELDPESVTLFDPTIRKALQATDPATGKFVNKPLWQFESEVKHDARFDTTKQGRTASAELQGALTSMFQGS
jgi:hypothetical protein